MRRYHLPEGQTGRGQSRNRGLENYTAANAEWLAGKLWKSLLCAVACHYALGSYPQFDHHSRLAKFVEAE